MRCLRQTPTTWLCPKYVKILLKHNRLSEELARIDGKINAKCEALIVHSASDEVDTMQSIHGAIADLLQQKKLHWIGLETIRDFQK